MKKPEMMEFKTLLTAMRARLRGDVRQLTSEALGSGREDMGNGSKSPTHMAELGSDTFEQDFALSLVENDQETLKAIDIALQRIDEGTYGTCEKCQEDGKTPARSIIRKTRLRAIPFARNCIDCESKLEQFH